MHAAGKINRWLTFALAACAGLLCAGGCGGESVYPVTFSFALANGGPLTAGTVALQQTENPAILGGGAIASDGTCQPVKHGSKRPGLPAGTYQIAVYEPPSIDPDNPSPPPAFARRYSNPAASGLTATVNRTTTAPIRFVLEPEPPAARR